MTGKARFEGIENAWILVSGRRVEKKLASGNSYDTFKATMTFLYDAGGVAAEWEPEYGPIQVWHKCDECDPGAREHYYFDYVNDGPLNWSQLAVEECQLHSAFENGEYAYIFRVLKDWAND